jgi:preprotein translocase subunit YajC
MFISPAYAQAAGGGAADVLPQLLLMAAVFVVFYFLLIRPQQKKVKEHKAMIDAVKRGDRVVMSGGLVGTIQRIVSDREAILEIGEGVRVRVIRAMIAEVMAKTEPLAADDKPEKAAKKASSEPTYWSMLGVPEGAGQAEIDAAIAAKGADPALAEAVDTLKDPVKRKLYARLGHGEYVATLKD